MDTLLTLSCFNTLFVILFFSSTISPQLLYEDGDRIYNEFNAKSKEIAVQTFREKIEVRRKETEVQFEQCRKREDPLSESYTKLLKMINKGQFPDGIVFVQSLSFHNIYLYLLFSFILINICLFKCVALRKNMIIDLQCMLHCQSIQNSN